MFSVRKCIAALLTGLGLCGVAQAQTAETIVGLQDSSITFTATGASATLSLGGSLVGAVRVEVWAFQRPYTGNPFNGRMLVRWDASKGGPNTPDLWFENPGDGSYHLAVLAYAQTSDFQTRPVGPAVPKACMVKYNDLGNWSSTDTQYCAFDVAAFASLVGSLRCGGGRCVTSASMPTDIIPETGGWWNPSENGRGFFIEKRNGVLAMSFQLYDSSGAPTWYITSGPITSDGSFSAQLVQYGGGQTLTGAYSSPGVVNANVGTVSIKFSDDANGILTLPDGRQIPIERLRF